ncbi:MAG: IS21 family transposase, partial [Planctomycetota bacterium]|nr:IS21 family transposase [Planctomycetota bacterium]
KLPERKLDCFKRVEARVGRGSIIHVLNNTYSVPSRLIGEKVQVRVHADNLEVWFGQKHVETIPRLQGRQHHHINYRHIIHWLVRKPGAFQNYRYREALFPSSHFRMTYDWLRQRRPATADKEYLRILELAARENETTVDDVLRHLFNEGHAIAFEHVEAIVQSAASLPPATSVNINPVNLSDYDSLLGNELENES